MVWRSPAAAIAALCVQSGPPRVRWPALVFERPIVYGAFASRHTDRTTATKSAAERTRSWTAQRWPWRRAPRDPCPPRPQHRLAPPAPAPRAPCSDCRSRRVSAAVSPFRMSLMRSAGRPLLRSSWSRYARASAKLGGHTVCGCSCALNCSYAHRLRRVDLVLRQVRARRQLVHVEAALLVGRDDHAVVPVRGPVAAARAAIEEADLDRVRRIGPVEHRRAALIERLHHDVAPRHRDQRCRCAPCRSRRSVCGAGIL